jgi:hypothetical protein
LNFFPHHIKYFHILHSQLSTLHSQLSIRWIRINRNIHKISIFIACWYCFAGADGYDADADFAAGSVGGVDFYYAVDALGGYNSCGVDGGDGSVAGTPDDGFVGGVCRIDCSFQRFSAFERDGAFGRCDDDAVNGDDNGYGTGSAVVVDGFCGDGGFSYCMGA